MVHGEGDADEVGIFSLAPSTQMKRKTIVVVQRPMHYSEYSSTSGRTQLTLEQDDDKTKNSWLGAAVDALDRAVWGV